MDQVDKDGADAGKHGAGEVEDFQKARRDTLLRLAKVAGYAAPVTLLTLSAQALPLSG